MLVLSRKVEERIQIGVAIEITILEIRRGHVKLGITAPRDVPVRRAELAIAAAIAEQAAIVPSFILEAISMQVGTIRDQPLQVKELVNSVDGMR